MHELFELMTAIACRAGGAGCFWSTNPNSRWWNASSDSPKINWFTQKSPGLIQSRLFSNSDIVLILSDAWSHGYRQSLPGNWHSTDHILPKLASCFVLTTQMRKASQDPKSKACWSVYAWQFKVNHSFKYLHFGPLYLPIQLLYTWPFVISRTCLSSFTKLP